MNQVRLIKTAVTVRYGNHNYHTNSRKNCHTVSNKMTCSTVLQSGAEWSRPRLIDHLHYITNNSFLSCIQQSFHSKMFSGMRFRYEKQIDRIFYQKSVLYRILQNAVLIIESKSNCFHSCKIFNLYRSPLQNACQ